MTTKYPCDAAKEPLNPKKISTVGLATKVAEKAGAITFPPASYILSMLLETFVPWSMSYMQWSS
jgi:hypothetical protein